MRPLGNLGFARHGLSLNLELRPYGESGGPNALRQVVRGGGSGGSADGVSGIHTPSAFWPNDSEKVTTMSDPILEEIWRVREQLIQRHGGVKGYFRYVQKLDRSRRQRGRQQLPK